MTQTSTDNLIHVARYTLPNQGKRLLFLRQKDPSYFAWYEETQDGEEVETDIGGANVEDALRLAHKKWREYYFTTLNCGFRYTLPERDEHGSNALFHQMMASYASANGVYFDQNLGHNCYVQAASQEALDLWHRLQNEGKMPVT